MIFEKQPVIRTANDYRVIVYTNLEAQQEDTEKSKSFKRYKYAREYAESVSLSLDGGGCCVLWDMQHRFNTEIYTDPTDAHETFVQGKLITAL